MGAVMVRRPKCRAAASANRAPFPFRKTPDKKAHPGKNGRAGVGEINQHGARQTIAAQNHRDTAHDQRREQIC